MLAGRADRSNLRACAGPARTAPGASAAHRLLEAPLRGHDLAPARHDEPNSGGHSKPPGSWRGTAGPALPAQVRSLPGAAGTPLDPRRGGPVPPRLRARTHRGCIQLRCAWVRRERSAPSARQPCSEPGREGAGPARGHRARLRAGARRSPPASRSLAASSSRARPRRLLRTAAARERGRPRAGCPTRRGARHGAEAPLAAGCAAPGPVWMDV